MARSGRVRSSGLGTGSRSPPSAVVEGSHVTRFLSAGPVRPDAGSVWPWGVQADQPLQIEELFRYDQERWNASPRLRELRGVLERLGFVVHSSEERTF